MLLTMLAIGVISGGAVLNLAAKSVNNETESQINDTKNKTDELIKSTKSAYKYAVEQLENNIEQMNHIKMSIRDNDIKYFAKVFRKIRNFELRHAEIEMYPEIGQVAISLESNINGSNEYKHNDDSLSKGEIAGQLVMTAISPVLTFGFNLGKALKLSDKLDVANAEYEKIRMECDRVERTIALYRDTKYKCIEVSSVLKKIRPIFRLSIDKMKEICEKNSYNYSDFSEQEKLITMTCVNMAAGVNDIICTEIVNEDGTINDDAVKVISKAKEIQSASSESIEMLNY